MQWSRRGAPPALHVGEGASGPGEVIRGEALEKGVTRDAARLAAVQAGLAAAAAGGFLLVRGGAAAGAALAGSGVALVLTVLHARRVRLAARATKSRPGAETLVLGLGVFERFAVAAVLFALLIGYWELAPLPVIAGFAACQLGWFLAGALHRPGGNRRP